MSQNSDKLTLKDFPKSLISMVVMILFLAAFMVWDQSYWWESRDDYSFGYLVPLFALYVIYDRKESILGFLANKDAVGTDDKSGSALWICNLIALSGFIAGVLLYLVRRSFEGGYYATKSCYTSNFYGLCLTTTIFDIHLFI